ncbi:MAG TPA: 4-hydroxybenzoate 3-monooxygenase [Solirubrobacteraceae bacterium]|nr:4-hydroxybenzoate 3-monooxygenase [Solirubrobacteraceae bacterium]
MVTPDRTQVAIIGAGPAGLTLGRLLERQGIEAVILEARSREYCEARVRAGVLEQGTRDALIVAGVGERLQREGIVHGGIYLQLDAERAHIPMHELSGRAVTIYGQTEVVKDLIAARIETGAPLLFEVENVRIDGLDADRPVIRYRQAGVERELHADFVAGCDGFHGISRQTIPAGVQQIWQRDYPFAWLGILARVAPSTDELIYARNSRGFALHSMRSHEVSRLYVQVDTNTDVADWPDARIWEELHARFATPGWELREGPVTEKSITPMRSFVAAPMRYRNLFLAGDAAHIVPPTGAKGLNLAVADVICLADAFAEHAQGSGTALDAYSDRCLERVWRAQHFSWWMTQMLHLDSTDDAYADQLARSQLRYVCNSQAAATSLSENYVGLPLGR